MGSIPGCLLIGTHLLRLRSFNTGSGTELRYHGRYYEDLPLQGGGRCAGDQKEPEQAGAFLGKPVYCISRTGLNVSMLHLRSPYTHTLGQFLSMVPTTRILTEGGTLMTNQTRLS